MALTAKQVSGLAVALLTRSLVLPMTVARIPGGEFAGANGDTVTVRVRTPRSAKTQATAGAAITIDSIAETPVDVTLSHLYDAVNVTDQELSLQLVDFGMQVTEPQVRSVAIGAEDQIAAAMNALVSEQTFTLTASPADTKAQIQKAREALTTADVPAGDRWLAVSPQIMTRLLNVDEFVRADALGDGRSTALRDAVVGRIYGMTVVESNGLADGTAVAYHRSGFAFANRTPVTPRGANESATATEGGIGMRHLFQYSPANLQDQSVVSTFAGASVVDANRVFKLTTSTV